MNTPYLWLELTHIFIAVVALGTSAGLGILLEFYASDATHGPFILRAIERLTAVVVLPGYVLVLATGLWMASVAWPFTARWIQAALGLWVVGLACLVFSMAALRNQGRAQARGGDGRDRYAAGARVSGGAFGFVVVAILSLMVFKP